MLIGRLSQMSPPPCLYDTVIQSYVQLKSRFYGVGRPISFQVFRNVKSMRFFWPLFRPWGEHRTPDRL